MGKGRDAGRWGILNGRGEGGVNLCGQGWRRVGRGGEEWGMVRRGGTGGRGKGCPLVFWGGRAPAKKTSYILDNSLSLAKASSIFEL